MNQFFVNHIALFIILLIILLVIGILMVSTMYQKQMQLQKRLKALTKGRKASSMEGIIQECISSVASMEDKYAQMNDYIMKNVEKRIGAALYKSKMVRYDAFEGQGGELSFIWILLDSGNNGYLLHNVYSREGSSCLYTRVIQNGESTSRLSPEEEKLLNELIQEI